MIWNQITWLEQLFYLSTLNRNQSNKNSGLLIQQDDTGNICFVAVPSMLDLKWRKIKIWVFFWKQLLKVACNKTSETWSAQCALYPGYQRFFHAYDKELRRPQAEDTSGGSLERLEWNRKPRMKSLWHPGYVLLSADTKRLEQGSPANISSLLNENWLKGVFWKIIVWGCLTRLFFFNVPVFGVRQSWAQFT